MITGYIIVSQSKKAFIVIRMNETKTKNAYGIALLVVMLTAIAIPISAEGSEATIIDSGSCGNGLTWQLSDTGVLTVSGSGPMADWSSDSPPWKNYRADIKEVILGGSVTSVGAYAFLGCASLISADMPAVKSIGSMAFYGCSSMSSVDLPVVKTIGAKSFWGCTSISTVSMPSALYIGDYAFYLCVAMTSVTIPETVLSIESEAFYGLEFYAGSEELFYDDLPGYDYTGSGNGILYRYIENPDIIITSISSVDLGSLPAGSSFKDAGAPSAVIGYCSDGTTTNLAVVWDSSEFVSEPGTYTMSGTVTPPAGYCLSKDLASDIVAYYTISQELSGIADIVFIIDTTGSMSSEISNVKSNIKAFAQELQETGMSVRWALIEYQDITCDGLDSTKIIKNGAEAWYTDINAYQNAIGSLTLGDGGDDPETVIDGLEAARALSFRDAAGKFFVVVTDAEYKVNNNYGVASMADEISNLVSDSIATFVVTSTSCYSYYQNLTNDTGGMLLDINSNFSAGLMDMAERIGSSNISSLRIATSPDKTVYAEGDTFDPTGMIVEAVYENGTVRQIDSYTIDATAPLSVTDEYVTVSFGEFTVDVPITVTPGSSGEITAEGTLGDALTWTLDDKGTLTVYGTGAMPDIGPGKQPWKDYRSDVNTIVVGNGITAIGDYSFAGCAATTVSVPASVKEIHRYAFAACDMLNSITLPGVEIIGSNAFFGCNKMATADMPAVKSIGYEAFMGCSNLESIDIPAVETIRERAFHLGIGVFSVSFGESEWSSYSSGHILTKLTCLSLPASLTSLAEDSFYVPSLQSFEGSYPAIVDGIFLISESKILAVAPASLDSELVISNSVTSLGGGVFRNLDALETVTLPDSVTYIGDYAFYDCYSLKAVTMPDSLTYIGDYAFYYCSSLETVTLPDSVTYIGDYAFYRCDLLETVTLPESLTYLGNYVFYECYSLKAVTIPDSVTRIGYGAFNNCYSLETVTLPESLTQICSYAFDSCYSLETVTLPESLTYLDNCAFTNCTSLTSFEGSYPGIVDGIYLLSGTKLVAVALASIEAEPTLPDSLTSIGNHAFSNCKSLKVISLPESVTSIGSYAFRYCSSLKTVDIPDSVTYIGWSAFQNCTSLESVYLPESVTWLDGYTFNSCPLSSLYLPSSLTYVYQLGFTFYDSDGTTKLEENASTLRGYSYENISGKMVRVAAPQEGDTFASSSVIYTITSLEPLTASVTGYEEGLTNLVIPAKITHKGLPFAVESISNNAFYGCITLESVDLGSVSSVSTKAFANCTNLIRVDAGDSLKILSAYAFYGCTHLTDVILDDSADTLKTIGSKVFLKCTSLNSITIPEGLRTLGTSVFSLKFTDSDGNELEQTCESLRGYHYDNFDGNLTRYYVEAGQIYTIDGVKYRVSGTSPYEMTVMGYVEGIEKANILGAVNYIGCRFDVVSIEESAFEGCATLKSVSIGSVDTIGIKAFYGCSALTVVHLGDVDSIGTRAFTHCTSLKYLDLGENVKSIGAYAFYNCSDLSRVTLPDSVETLGAYAFFKCNSISYVDFSESLESIGSKAFSVTFLDSDGKTISVTSPTLAGHIFKGTERVLGMIA